MAYNSEPAAIYPTAKLDCDKGTTIVYNITVREIFQSFQIQQVSTNPTDFRMDWSPTDWYPYIKNRTE